MSNIAAFINTDIQNTFSCVLNFKVISLHPFHTDFAVKESQSLVQMKLKV